MKEHFCPVEHSIIAYQGQCNWCGEKEKEWVGLTDEEIDKTLEAYEQDYNWISFAKAIENKLKEKNT